MSSTETRRCGGYCELKQTNKKTKRPDRKTRNKKRLRTKQPHVLRLLSRTFPQSQFIFQSRRSLTFSSSNYKRPLETGFMSCSFVLSVLPQQRRCWSTPPLLDLVSVRAQLATDRITTSPPPERLLWAVCSGARRSSCFLSVSCCTEAYAYITPAGPLLLLLLLLLLLYLFLSHVTHVVVML